MPVTTSGKASSSAGARVSRPSSSVIVGELNSSHDQVFLLLTQQFAQWGNWFLLSTIAKKLASLAWFLALAIFYASQSLSMKEQVTEY